MYHIVKQIRIGWETNISANNAEIQIYITLRPPATYITGDLMYTRFGKLW